MPKYSNHKKLVTDRYIYNFNKELDKLIERINTLHEALNDYDDIIEDLEVQLEASDIEREEYIEYSHQLEDDIKSKDRRIEILLSEIESKNQIIEKLRIRLERNNE